MPQLVKGGKYIFGWSHVSDTGRICIPREAREEYEFRPGEKIILISGSRTSKGFAVTTPRRIQDCAIYRKLSTFKALMNFQELPDGFIRDKEKIYTWSQLDGKGCFETDKNILALYHVKPGENLLVGRGSGFALAFIKTGKIVKEAQNHPELIVCT